MIDRIISKGIFYKHDGMILIQERKDLGKDVYDVWLFWGACEDDESPEDTLIREIREELNIDLLNQDFVKIGHTIHTDHRDQWLEFFIFAIPWDDRFERDFMILEGSWYYWLTPGDFLRMHTYPIHHIHIELFLTYLQTKNPHA